MAPRGTTKQRKPRSVKEAADSAEQRSGKAPKAETAKATEKAPKATNTDDQDRALFLDYLPKVAAGKKAIADATNALRTLYKQAKADGMLKSDFDEAILMQGTEGEKVKKAAIARSLKIARWLGMNLGSQLDMFEQDEHVPATDRAFEEGKSQAMLGISLKCDYAPETEQYRRFAQGWHEGQAVLSKGFKKLHPEVQKDEIDKAAKKSQREAQQAEDAKVFDAPASGVAMTRAEFEAQKAANAKPA